MQLSFCGGEFFLEAKSKRNDGCAAGCVTFSGSGFLVKKTKPTFVNCSVESRIQTALHWYHNMQHECSWMRSQTSYCLTTSAKGGHVSVLCVCVFVEWSFQLLVNIQEYLLKDFFQVFWIKYSHKLLLLNEIKWMNKWHMYLVIVYHYDESIIVHDFWWVCWCSCSTNSCFPNNDFRL